MSCISLPQIPAYLATINLHSANFYYTPHNYLHISALLYVVSFCAIIDVSLCLVFAPERYPLSVGMSFHAWDS